MNEHWPPHGPQHEAPARRVDSDVAITGQDQLHLVVRWMIDAALARVPEHELEAAMGEVCTFAHSEHIPVERVLIALRAEWEAAVKPRTPRWQTLEEIRGDLVSRCIEQFYHTRS